MTAPIITIDVLRLSVEVAELQIQAKFADDPGTGAELRGRLMGPRCPGMSTIEIAYAVKPIANESSNILLARVIIPEPNLWTEKKPFTYWGPVEVWQDGAMVHSQQVEVGLRKAN